jgi:hypothetical protein
MRLGITERALPTAQRPVGSAPGRAPDLRLGRGGRRGDLDGRSASEASRSFWASLKNFSWTRAPAARFAWSQALKSAQPASEYAKLLPVHLAGGLIVDRDGIPARGRCEDLAVGDDARRQADTDGSAARLGRCPPARWAGWGAKRRGR